MSKFGILMYVFDKNKRLAVRKNNKYQQLVYRISIKQLKSCCKGNNLYLLTKSTSCGFNWFSYFKTFATL